MANDFFTAPPQDQMQQGNNTQQADPSKDYLSELVGEDKKFKTPADLARGKYEADQFIARLEREQAELREELNRRLTAEDLLKKLEERNNPQQQGNVSTPDPTTSQGEQQSQQTANGGSSSQLTEEEIQKLLDSRLTQREKEQRAERNVQTAIAEMQSAWGENARVELHRKANQLGISPEQLEGYARQNPNVFLTLVGLKKEEPQRTVNNPVPPQTSTNSGADNFTGNTTKNYAYYQKIRQTDRKKYLSKEIQNEMHREAIKQGEAFYS